MINDKKLEEAKDNIFNKHFLKNNEGMICVDHISEPVYLDYQIKQAIELGAKWAINKLLKDLWHDAFKECIPQGKKVVVEYTYKGGIHYRSIKIPDDIQWVRGFSNEKRLRRWMYVDDLFPKEGDE